MFEDYEYVDDFDYDDYEEVVYEYEYEDSDSPEIIVEYQYVDDDPPAPSPPKPKYKPRYRPHKPHYKPHKPSYSHSYSNLHGHQLPKHQYSSYQPYPQRQPHYYNHPRHSQSGPQFLEKVSGLLEAAEATPPHITLSGSLRSALLKDVDHIAQAELRTGPGGRVC